MYVPRGVFSERTLALTKEMGYYNVFWSLAFWIGKWMSKEDGNMRIIML